MGVIDEAQTTSFAMLGSAIFLFWSDVWVEEI